MSKLKPCPFCGSPAIIEQESNPSYLVRYTGDWDWGNSGGRKDYYKHWVRCSNEQCGVTMGACKYFFVSKEKAIQQWNARNDFILVYCTSCRYFEFNSTTEELNCIHAGNCYFYDTEDSRPLSLRKKYEPR